MGEHAVFITALRASFALFDTENFSTVVILSFMKLARNCWRYIGAAFASFLSIDFEENMGREIAFV